MSKADRLLEEIRSHLDPGEHIVAGVMGTFEGKQFHMAGTMVATERRVVFFSTKLTGFDIESFPYERISSFEQGKNMVASGNTAEPKWIHRDSDMDGFVAYVRTAMAKKPDAVAASVGPIDVADQIRQQAGLRDAGLLTEEEFTAKKTELEPHVSVTSSRDS